MGGGEAGAVSEESGAGGEGETVRCLCFMEFVLGAKHRHVNEMMMMSQ